VSSGVSVVIRSYRGAEAASTTIATLDAQALDHELFDESLVADGPAAGDLESFEVMRRRVDPSRL
jgi:hypothetical protein